MIFSRLFGKLIEGDSNYAKSTLKGNSLNDVFSGNRAKDVFELFDLRFQRNTKSNHGVATTLELRVKAANATVSTAREDQLAVPVHAALAFELFLEGPIKISSVEGRLAMGVI